MGNTISMTVDAATVAPAWVKQAVVLAAVVLGVRRLFLVKTTKRQRPDYTIAATSSSSSEVGSRSADSHRVKSTDTLSDTSLPFGALDVRRIAQLATGKAVDHSGDVTRSYLDSFDLNKTIFHSIEGVLPRTFLYHRLAVELYWCDRAVSEINESYQKVEMNGCPTCVSRHKATTTPFFPKLSPQTLRPSAPLSAFMSQQCNFAMEHADGSFVDHLRFCAEYSARHYPQHSPRILLLHSIMGVGTNFFPMAVEKEPHLKTLVSAEEFTQIEAFPSVLRLMNTRDLIQELTTRAADANRLKSITFHRVIDNKERTLTGEQLWIALNLQLIHLLDFLPAGNWVENEGDSFLENFREMRTLLLKTNKLDAHVDVDSLTQREPAPDGRPFTVARALIEITPSAVKRSMAVSAQRKLSKKIGHSLKYTLEWA